MRTKELPRSVSAWSLTLLLAQQLAAQQPLPPSFEEAWAFATDRAALVATKIAGTKDWFYYHCRERLDAGDFAAVDAALSDWRSAFSDDGARQTEIDRRRHLLDAARDPAATFAWLREQLELRFDHRRPDAVAAAELPTRLDPALIDRETLLRQALANHQDLSGFTPDALPWLATQPLDGERLTRFLILAGEAKRFDLPGLPDRIVVPLRAESWRDFGTRKIHGQLRLEQLDECLRLAPELLQKTGFVDAYLGCLAAEAEAEGDLDHDPAVRAHHLERLDRFVSRLGPVHNELRAHVLKHHLAEDLRAGRVDPARLLAYVVLPHRGDFAVPALAANAPEGTTVADTHQATGLGAGEKAADVLRACFAAHFATTADPAPFLPYVRAEWLQPILAEARLLHGDPDARRWQAMLGSAAAVEALERRIELAFVRELPASFAAADPVVLQLDSKNVTSVLVRVFALDAFRWYREKHGEFPIDLDLDGVTATHERTLPVDAPPLRRVRHRLELPELAGPGAWLVECVGGGLRSRVLVHKGRLHAVGGVAANGMAYRVYDETGAPVRDAALWCGDRDLLPGADGAIVLPFPDKQTTRTCVLHTGNRADLVDLEAAPEAYTLQALVHVDREALLAGARARLLLRPQLALLDCALPASRLQMATLTIVAKDLDDTAVPEVLRELTFATDREFVHEFQVPERTTELVVTLTGSVIDTRGETRTVAAPPVTFAVNGCSRTAATHAPLLVQTKDGFAIELRGRNGEPKVGKEVALELWVRGLADPVTTRLRTDAAGRVTLGPLPFVHELTILGGTGGTAVALPAPSFHPPTDLRGIVGETLRLAYPCRGGTPSREEFGLANAAHDEFDHLVCGDGWLELRGLPPGDHTLRLHRFGDSIAVRVVRGARDAGWLVGNGAHEAGPAAVLALGEPTVRGGELVVPVTGFSPATRVHVVATRYVPPFPLAERLAAGHPELDEVAFGRPALAIHDETPLGDEEQYVLDRRFQPKFPGNMLPRPSLLVNRLDVRLTESHGGMFGSRYGGRRLGGGKMGSRYRTTSTRKPAPDLGAFADLDWLPRPSATLANLVPGPDGAVHVPLAGLGDGQVVQVVALEGEQTAATTFVRDEAPLQPRPRTLAQALDGGEHRIDRKWAEPIAAGAVTPIGDPRHGRAALLGSLDDLHTLLTTFSADEDLEEFAFVLRWPQLAPDQKLASYAEHACHELHFFLFHKDRAFFDAVVKPLLAQKRVPTFLDQWLLGGDLQPWQRPEAFARLTFVERLLLARRVGGEARDAIVRAAEESVRQRPVDNQRADQRLDVALALGELQRRGEESPKAAPKEPPVLKDEDLPPADRAFYQSLKATHAYLEHDWWHRRRSQVGPDHVAPDRFWVDYAKAPEGRPFVPASALTLGDTFLERLMALAVVDLPFAAEAPVVTGDAAARTLRTVAPALLIRQDLAVTEPARGAPPLLLGEDFLRLEDEVQDPNAPWRDTSVRDEFVADVPYLCRVVVSNPTARTRNVAVLLQVPAGAIPVRKGNWTSQRLVTLSPYGSMVLDQAFYFPAAGDFAHYPAHASEGGAVLAFAAPRTLHVVAAPTRLDTDSWARVANDGTSDDVLAYVDHHDVAGLPFDAVAWRLGDRTFHRALVGRLRARHAYDATVWSYGLQHGDADTAREYLDRADAFVAGCGGPLESPLLSIDPVARLTYEHIEFDPLVAARAHPFVKAPHNRDLAAQWQALLQQLGYRRTLTAEDRLAATYYLMLQDRVGDALAMFAQVDRAAVRERMQYDYLDAYLCFFTRDTARARRLAEPYRELPLLPWRERFAEVLAQLDEAEGKAAAAQPTTERPGNEAGAAVAPSLELSLDGDRIVVRAQHLARCELLYYALDVEFAFSANPFGSKGGTTAMYVQPGFAETRDLPADRPEAVFDLPERFRRQNVRIEVRGGGLLRAETHFSNALAVRFLEPVGQLVVTEPGTTTPLPQTYVKVFANSDGAIRFHKDGYTDLRGRFDYASVSDDENPNATRYAVLVLHDQRGAVIREVAPPTK